MSSKSLLMRKTPGMTIIRDILSRMFWVPLTYTILNIVILSFYDSPGYAYLHYSGYSFDQLCDRINEFFPLHIIAIGISALVGCTIFSYLNRTNSASFMHGLPISREKLFFSHYAAGLILILVPALLSSVYLAIYQGHLVFAALVFATIAIYSIGVYSFAVMMCQLSANTLGGLIFTGFGLFVPLICEGFTIYLRTRMLFGYDDYNTGLEISRYFYVFPNEVLTEYGITYLVMIILFTGLALMLFKKRSIELSGDLIAFPKIRRAAIFICAVLAGMCAYLIFSSLFMFLLFGVLCAVLVNFAVRKSFTIKGTISPVLCVILVTAGIFVTFNYDLTGFERHIPETEEIESVVFIQGRRNYGVRNGWDNYNDKNYFYDSIYEPIRKAEDIEKVRELHKKIIDTKDSYSSDGMRRFSIIYTLKNGKTVSRYYRVYPDIHAEELVQVISLREFKTFNLEILSDKVAVKTARINGNGGKIMSFTDEQAERLRNAICTDVMNAPIEKNEYLTGFAADNLMHISFDYYMTEAKYEDGSAVPQSVLLDSTFSCSEPLRPYYTETMKVLRELGVGETAFDVYDGYMLELESYNHKVYDSVYTKRSTQITDTEEIREILKECFALSGEKVSTEIGGWNYNYYYVVRIFNEEGYVSEICVYVKNELLEEYLADKQPEEEYRSYVSEGVTIEMNPNSAF